MKTIVKRNEEYTEAIAVVSPIPGGSNITPDEYWQAVAWYRSGNLSIEEARHY